HELLQKNKIPIIPSFSYTGIYTDIPEKVRETGFPLIIKPAYGGGGLGMMTVSNPDELKNALESASLIAEQYFGDSALLVEKYLPGARHIEVQLISDGKETIHLFE